MNQRLKIGMAQISPVLLDKEKTTQKVIDSIRQAKNLGVELLVFGEALLPGYPLWSQYTNAALFDDDLNKDIHARYIDNAVQIEKGDLYEICKLSKEYSMAIYLGIIERAADRGSHSLYCSLVYINQEGEIQSVHRKLQPTFEERLSWAPGDGNGLRVHPLKAFHVGGLNCWENWMPLSRAALASQGENVHIAVWPGNLNNTKDITRFVARESRSYCISVSSVFRKSDFTDEFPHSDKIIPQLPEIVFNGGSCIAGPNGEFVVEPILEKEGVFVHEIELNAIFRERQNFDISGHYSRPDVTKLMVNRERQSIFNEG